jgi:Rod binding domain-containing protein
MNALNTVAAFSASAPDPTPTFVAGGIGKERATDALAKARTLEKTYGQFVGETFYGSMLKAMRQTVGEPAYFHGGQAEKLFQSQLDQQMSADLASGDGADLARSMFAKQFPVEANLLREAAERGEPLAELGSLRRL